MEDGVDDAVAATHLDCFEEALVLVHVLEDVRLQVAINDEDGAAGHVFQSHFERLDHLHHRLKRCLRGQNKLEILVDLLDLLDIDALRAIPSEGAKRRHRVAVSVFQRIGVHVAVTSGGATSLLTLLVFAFLRLNLLFLQLQDLLHPLDVPGKCFVLRL